MFKAKIQKPSKLTKLELKELKNMDTEHIRKKKERHQGNIETRQFFLEAQRRANYRDEYDRLLVENGNIPEIRRKHGDRVAELTSQVLSDRRHDLKDMYKQAFMQSRHRIEN